MFNMKWIHAMYKIHIRFKITYNYMLHISNCFLLYGMFKLSFRIFNTITNLYLAKHNNSLCSVNYRYNIIIVAIQLLIFWIVILYRSQRSRTCVYGRIGWIWSTVRSIRGQLVHAKRLRWLSEVRSHLVKWNSKLSSYGMFQNGPKPINLQLNVSAQTIPTQTHIRN